MTDLTIAYSRTVGLAVIGGGPAGVRLVYEVLKRDPQCQITLFGNEPYQPYNRAQLSLLLAGDLAYEKVFTELPNEAEYPGFRYVVSSITAIDSEAKTIRDKNNTAYHYDQLVIATGAKAHVPEIPGVSQKGVYTFRNLKDTEFLSARTTSARHVVIAGGGLLGLEAARALLKANTNVTVIQQGARLMNRQLDNDAAGLLQQKMQQLGVRIITNSGVRVIHGEGRVTGVTTNDKETIACDTVLICAGITPNTEIARDGRIKVARGIVVDDQLKTSRPDIFAIGECCEHRGLTYGLVTPGFEQAAVAADVICGGNATYKGSLQVSRLKVVGEEICSIGEVVDIPDRPLQKVISFNGKNTYRKLVVRKGRLVGAVAFGKWDEVVRLQEVFHQQHRVWPWQCWLFVITGNLWFKKLASDVNQWPRSTNVCQCNNISKGQLLDAMDGGCTNMAELCQATTAGTVCGTCKPLLGQLLGSSGPQEKEKAWLPVLAGSTLSILLALVVVFFPPLVVSDSVQSPANLELLWNDKFWKQVTGFSLVGMTAIGLLMSLRKRIKNHKLAMRLGGFAYWRLLHVLLGLLCAVTLVLHTGLNLGENLNQMLMINFLSILFIGSLAGVVIAVSHNFSVARSQMLRRYSTWVHILVAWPLPILLATHIVTVYYF